MPGSSLRSGLANSARTVTLRDSALTRASIALTLAGEIASGQSVDGHRHVLADGQRSAAPLRARENRRRSDRAAARSTRLAPTRDILPEIDVAQPEPPGERRLDRLLRDHRARALTVAAAESRAAMAASTVDCGVLPPAISVFCALERDIGVLELGEAVGEIRLHRPNRRCRPAARRLRRRRPTRNGSRRRRPPTCGAMATP